MDENNFDNDQQKRTPLVKDQAAEKPRKPSVESYLGCGFYQVYHLIMSQFVTIAHSSNMTLMAFGKIVPEWSCNDWADLNRTTSIAITKATNFTASQNSLSNNCELLSNYTCQNLTMVTEYKSVVYEWRLLCDGMKLVYLSLTMQMVGVIAGSQLWGQLADWYGRKWVLFIALFGQILFAAASIFSSSIRIFTIFRFIIGFFAAGTIVTNHVFFNEFVVSRHRLWMGAINSWGFAQMILALVAWWTADWKTTTIVCNFVAIPALFMICFVKESPSWLMQKGRNDAARRSLSRVTTMNRRGDDHMHDSSFNVHFKNKKYSFWHVFSRKSMTQNTIILSFVYFAISVISYGIIFDTDSFAGNKFLNFFLYATLKFVASILTICADAFSKSVGRRLIFWFSNSIVTLCCLAIFSFKIIGMDKTMLETVISIIAIMATSPIWTSLVLSSTELYPTPVRNVALSIVSVFSRIGGAVAPQVLYAAKFWAPLTYLIYFILAALSLLFHVVFIPETKGVVLPDDMPLKKSRKLVKLSKNDEANII